MDNLCEIPKNERKERIEKYANLFEISNNMNDDISSMSNGQICMISMILNFSILVNSSSKYNIIKLDEIDGGLDTESRTNFITVLNEIMDILGCEQCFLISHNEEIQYSSTDMIVLKTSSESSYYGDANIIFDAAKI